MKSDSRSVVCHLSHTEVLEEGMLLGRRHDDSRKITARSLTFRQLCMSLGYIEEFEEIDDHRSGKIVVQLNGRINKCGVISPRFNVQLAQIESWINLLLPARSFGYLILTTSAGIMDHEEARRKHVAGKVLGFIY